MAKVSIIIPTHNYARFLGEAIQSVLDQTYKDFELIVVDDGSTDNTKEVVSSFKDDRIRYMYQDHVGVSAAQNMALRIARGEYITGLSADDIYLPQNVEKKVELLDSRPDIGLVCSDTYIFDDSTGANIGRLWHDPKRLNSWFDPVKATLNPLREFIQWGFFIMLQATMVRRRVFETVGYFDESLPTHEDWEFIIRVLQHFSIEIIDTPLLKLRRHKANISINEEQMYIGAIAAVNKAIHSGSFSRKEVKLLKETLSPQHSRFGRWAILNGKGNEARKALFMGIKFAPLNIQLYKYFLLSLLGTKKVRTLRNWKRCLTHRHIKHGLARKEYLPGN
jgi:glycosyltransferase involved in cell wall biosynthesis